MAHEKGPFLAAALLCERVLQEQEGTLSAIRIVDRVIQQAVGPEAPGQMPPLSVQLTLLLIFRSGEARGRFSVKLRPEDPSGHQLEPFELPLQLEGEERGANLIVNYGFVAELEGLYWIDVLLENDLLTRIPMRVMYQPRPSG